MASGTSRRERAESTCQRLIATARRHWQERGYEAASIGGILAEVGLARGGFYHHFADKRALFEAVRDQVEAEVLSWMRGASNSPGGPWSELRAACVLHVSACADPGVQRILLRDGPALLERGVEPRRAALQARLERALPDDPAGTAALAPLLLGALEAAALELADQPDADGWRQLHTSVTLLLEGLRLVSLQGMVPAVPKSAEEDRAWQTWQRRGASTPRS